MRKHKLKDISLIVRNYFDDIKQSKFIFDIVSVEMENDEEWLVQCEIANVFDEEPRVFEVRVDDESGDITDVREIQD